MKTIKGQIQVSTENIFPIIRKWLYSDQDIFLRELVSNASDAISKLEKLKNFGAYETEGEIDGKIEIIYDSSEKTLRVIDNGIGMNAEEIDKYINSIAYSGAVDFLKKYEDKSDGGGIIGHFGLGFYSVFMVADRVSIDTLSYMDGAEPVLWISESGQEFEMKSGTRKERGTCITIYLSREAENEVNAQMLRSTLHKYCQFMPYPIFFTDTVSEKEADERREKRFEDEKKEYEKKREEALKKGENFDEAEPVKEKREPLSPVNNTEPLWIKKPKDCSKEDYLSFYRECFNDFRDPLFWIHLNMDYPFKVQGILYFPRSEERYVTLSGRIKLYNNRVFVSDNVKEVIPEFLFLLKGVLDCPDLPLNVSRSFLQNDAYVRKLSDHIIRKVADKLKQIYTKEREKYDEYWKDISVFVKYGCLSEEKFFDRIKDYILFETVDGEMKTKAELGDNIYYISDPKEQAVYVRKFKDEGKTVVIMDKEIDISFISFLEAKLSPLKFLRVDAKIEGEAEDNKEDSRLNEIYKDSVPDKNIGIKFVQLKADGLPAMIEESEDSRRALEMRKQFERLSGKNSDLDLDKMFPRDINLVINTEHPLNQKIKEFNSSDDEGKKELSKELARQVYALARLGHGSLESAELADYVSSAVKLISELI